MAVLDPESNFATTHVLGVVADADTPVLISQFFLLKKSLGAGLDAPRDGLRKPTPDQVASDSLAHRAHRPNASYRVALDARDLHFSGIFGRAVVVVVAVGIGPASSLLFASPFTFAFAWRHQLICAGLKRASAIEGDNLGPQPFWRKIPDPLLRRFDVDAADVDASADALRNIPLGGPRRGARGRIFIV